MGSIPCGCNTKWTFYFTNKNFIFFVDQQESMIIFYRRMYWKKWLVYWFIYISFMTTNNKNQYFSNIFLCSHALLGNTGGILDVVKSTMWQIWHVGELAKVSKIIKTAKNQMVRERHLRVKNYMMHGCAVLLKIFYVKILLNFNKYFFYITISIFFIFSGIVFLHN